MKKGIKKKLLYLFISFTIASFSQTGPGGVGARNGSSSLIVWLRANDLNADGNINNNPTNGALISTWADFSGNSNNFTQSGTNRPTYNTTGIFNTARFDAVSGAAKFMNGSISGIYANASTFFVTNPVNFFLYKTGNPPTLFLAINVAATSMSSSRFTVIGLCVIMSLALKGAMFRNKLS